MFKIKTPAIAMAVAAALAGTTGYCAFNQPPVLVAPPITLYPPPAPVSPGPVERYPLAPLGEVDVGAAG